MSATDFQLIRSRGTQNIPINPTYSWQKPKQAAKRKSKPSKQ